MSTNYKQYYELLEAKLRLEHAKDLSESEIDRILDSTVLPLFNKRVLAEMVSNGFTL